jgi:hypothetical protein
MANGTKCKYHSLVPSSDAQKHLILRQIEELPVGSVISLEEPPFAVNVCLMDEELRIQTTCTDDYDDHPHVSTEAENERSAAAAAAVRHHMKLWAPYSMVQDRIIVPILAKRKKHNACERTIVRGGEHYSPSRIEIRQNFPIEPAFAATVYKAEGRTISHVILALAKRSAAMCDLTYEALCFALSRVKTKDGIRLLLNSRHPWETLEYIWTLRPDKKVQAFFQGYGRPARRSHEME